MKCLAFAIAAAALVCGPCFGADSPKRPRPVEPCGWSEGGLPDPAVTHACLEQRFKASKPRDDHDPPPAPSRDGADVPPGR